MFLRNPINAGKMLIAVEGDDDKRLYEKLFHSNRVIIVPLYGCLQFENIHNYLNPSSFHSKFFSIKDADFDVLNSIPSPHDNLFLTDGHDMEMMILSESKLKEILPEYNLNSSLSSPLIQNSFSDLENISYIKWKNSRKSNDQIGIKFKKYPLINNLGKSVKEILIILYAHPDNTDAHVIAENDVLQLKSDNPNPNPFHLHRGHDVCRTLSVKIKALTQKNMKKTDLLYRLQDHYSSIDFKETGLFQAIKDYLTPLHKEDILL